MNYFHIEGDEKQYEFGVGSAGIIPKTGELVTLRTREGDFFTVKNYKVVYVRYILEGSSFHVMKDIIVGLSPF